MVKAIESGQKQFGSEYFGPEKKLTLELAALFHEADDRKYFPTGTQHAKALMEKALRHCDGGKNTILDNHSQIVKEALKMIDYCSTSRNGNSVP